MEHGNTYYPPPDWNTRSFYSLINSFFMWGANSFCLQKCCVLSHWVGPTGKFSGAISVMNHRHKKNNHPEITAVWHIIIFTLIKMKHSCSPSSASTALSPTQAHLITTPLLHHLVATRALCKIGQVLRSKIDSSLDWKCQPFCCCCCCCYYIIMQWFRLFHLPNINTQIENTKITSSNKHISRFMGINTKQTSTDVSISAANRRRLSGFRGYECKIEFACQVESHKLLLLANAG